MMPQQRLLLLHLLRLLQLLLQHQLLQLLLLQLYLQLIVFARGLQHLALVLVLISVLLVVRDTKWRKLVVVLVCTPPPGEPATRPGAGIIPSPAAAGHAPAMGSAMGRLGQLERGCWFWYCYCCCKRRYWCQCRCRFR